MASFGAPKDGGTKRILRDGDDCALIIVTPKSATSDRGSR
jgi:hypothetical protein